MTHSPSSTPPNKSPKRRHLLATLSILNVAFLILLWIAETFIAERFWLTTGLLYFPQHWIGIPAIVLLVWSLYTREIKLSLLKLASTFFFAIYFLGFNIPFRAEPVIGTPIRVMTYNIHYGSGGAANIVEVIEQQKPDIVCMQETRAFGTWRDPVPELQRLLPGWHMSRGAEVATFSRHPIIRQKAHPMGQPFGRVVLETVVNVRGQQLSVFNTHISTGGNFEKCDRPKYWWTMPRYVLGTAEVRAKQLPILLKAAQGATTPAIIAGDFNNPPRGLFYRKLTRDFRDAFDAAGWGTGFTFRSDLPVLRIDHILAGAGVAVHRCHVPRVNASDHRPVVAEISLLPK